jgi:hypothetical protein
MKKGFTFLIVFLCIKLMAQNVIVSYNPSTENFPNPERGFYKYSDSQSSNGYNLLNQSSITNYRTNQGITLIFRYFYLNDFVDSSIPQSYLNNMQIDFNRIRNAGLKAIIRFAYSDDYGDDVVLDATKSRILEHINQIKPLLIANADVIAVMQAGFIGAWGEWYYTDQAEFGGWGYNQTNLTTVNYNHRKDITNAILSALPNTRSVQVRYPKMKQQMYNTTTPLPPSQAFTSASLARIGHHNDCFLSSNTDVGTYTNINTEYPYLEQETKFLPMGGETCAVFESRTNCTTAQYEMEKFHWSYLNLDYHPSVINGWQTNECFSDIQKNLGYRFELTTATFPESVAANETMSVTLNIKNVGYAAPFNERNAYLVLKNTVTNQKHSILLNTDPRDWLETKNITENLTLPTDIVPGSYKLYLHLPDIYETIANRPEYAIRFANNNMWDSTTGYNDLNHTVVINQPLSLVDNERTKMILYPIPASNELFVENDEIEEFKFVIYNSIGQEILINSTQIGNKISFDIQSLSNGIYFLQFENGLTKDSRRFIVKH